MSDNTRAFLEGLGLPPEEQRRRAAAERGRAVADWEKNRPWWEKHRDEPHVFATRTHELTDEQLERVWCDARERVYAIVHAVYPSCVLPSHEQIAPLLVGPAPEIQSIVRDEMIKRGHFRLRGLPTP